MQSFNLSFPFFFVGILPSPTLLGLFRTKQVEKNHPLNSCHTLRFKCVHALLPLLPIFRCWLLLLTGNIYWSDPELIPIPPHLLLPICYSVYLILLAHFLLSIRHTSHCLPRYIRKKFSRASKSFDQIYLPLPV